MTIQVPIAELRHAALTACHAAGASEALARALVEATISAEWHGRAEMGCAHLLDYFDGLRSGRINGNARPELERPLPAILKVDGQRGIAQQAFDLAFVSLTEAAGALGIAMLAVRDCYTAGEIGYYVRRLAAEGLIALAWANSHAMMASEPGLPATFGTNPLAFAAPGGAGPLVIDQASSATAFVNLARAAQNGMAIPAGWAIDAQRCPTTDPALAVLGALLPAGGAKGANIALMVEVMAAGLTGSHWSLDAGHFRTGSQCPGTGLCIIAIAPTAIAPDFTDRLDQQLARLARMGVHIPGQRARREACCESDAIAIEPEVWRAISG